MLPIYPAPPTTRIFTDLGGRARPACQKERRCSGRLRPPATWIAADAFGGYGSPLQRPLARRQGLLPFFDARNHAAHTGDAFSFSQNVEAVAIGTPMQDLDLLMPDTPAVHRAAGGFIEVNRARADQRAAVVVDDVFIARAHDPKPSAEGEAGPIGGGAFQPAAGKMLA